MNHSIDIRHLYKSYGGKPAVQDLSFSVAQGELFAFLGINGAGKTTTIHILCGQLSKDSGTVRVNGKPVDSEPDAVKRALGVVFQSSLLDRMLSVRDNLECRAALYGIVGRAFRTRLAELAARLEFADQLSMPLHKLSGGQRRRIDIARALFHNPDILVLDEPTTGLDPRTRRLIWDFVDEIRRTEGKTVLLTTHYMEEAAQADAVLILDAGKVAAQGSPLELKTRYSKDCLTLYGVEEAEVRSLEIPYEKTATGYRIVLPNPAAATDLILRHPSVFRDYELVKGNMDTVFLTVVGKSLPGGEMQ